MLTLEMRTTLATFYLAGILPVPFTAFNTFSTFFALFSINTQTTVPGIPSTPTAFLGFIFILASHRSFKVILQPPSSSYSSSSLQSLDLTSLLSVGLVRKSSSHPSVLSGSSCLIRPPPWSRSSRIPSSNSLYLSLSSYLASSY
jgi:hypothetical protein